MNENKKAVFIINPKSGTTGKEHIVDQINRLLDENIYTAFDICKTEYQGHATEIAAKAAADNVSVVCAVGGDGTVNETAKALVNTDTALAIIPCGSGNGLARHLHIPMESSRAIAMLNRMNIRTMDYGKVNNIPFFCTCGMGFDAFISMKFAQAGRRGPMTYIENILRSGLNYNPETYDIEFIDDKEEHRVHKAFLISCANASQYGNNAYIAPKASVSDGLMDVTIIEPFTVIDAPTIAIQLFNGTIDQNSRIKSFRCRKLMVHREKPGVIHYDGDPIMTDKDICVEIVPNALKCVCSDSEGWKDVAGNLQNMIVEHFNDMYMKSEVMIQKRNQQIQKFNRNIKKKLTGKN